MKKDYIESFHCIKV